MQKNWVLLIEVMRQNIQKSEPLTLTLVKLKVACVYQKFYKVCLVGPLRGDIISLTII